jgi:hypothetical protein
MTLDKAKAVEYCVNAHDFICSQLMHTAFPVSPRNDLVYAYLSIALEHQHAICNLMSANLIGSALALLRLQLEASFRGLWIQLVASDVQVNELAQGGKEPFPQFKWMAAELEAAYSAGDWLSNFIDYWSTLNGFTHSGLEQLGRRFRDDGHIGPNYPDEMVAEFAMWSGTISIGTVVPIFRQFGFNDKADATEKWLVDNGVIQPEKKTL